MGLSIAFRATGSGVSIPQKTVQNDASRIISSRSGDSMIFRVASHANSTDNACASAIRLSREAIPSRLCDCRQNCRRRSKRRPCSRSPRLRPIQSAVAAVSSARSPVSSGISQNSQRYGYPLENCTLAKKVLRHPANLYAGVGNRAIGNCSPVVNRICRWPFRALSECCQQRVCCVSQFTQMQVVEIRIIFRAARYRRAAQHRHLSQCVRSPVDVIDLFALNVHSAD